MQTATTRPYDATVTNIDIVPTPAPSVSWSAVVAGALISAAMSLILILLGSGIGLASVSPWSNAGISATTFTIATAIWLALTQFISSGLGGYLTGRLRAKWSNAYNDEVYFRDTAHGLLSWALATVLAAALLTATISSMVGSGVNAATAVTAGAAAGAANADMQKPTTGTNPDDYVVDNLFRSYNTNASNNDVHGEATLILARGIKDGKLSDADRTYLTQLVATRTGVSTDEAATRVDYVVGQINMTKEEAKQAADTARKATSQATLYTFLSLLIGAFIASYAATCGGRRRDEY